MGTIARGVKSGTGTVNFGSGDLAKSSEVNTDLNTIVTVINGNIDNDNIKSNAGIVASKLSLSTIAQNIANTGTFSNTGAVTITGATGITGAVDITGSLTADSLQLTTATVITAILDEDDMASDSAVALATQQSIKAYVDGRSGFGAPVSKNVDTSYLADSDGIAHVSLAAGNENDYYSVACKTDAANPPTTVFATAFTERKSGMTAATHYDSATFAVKKGDYYLVTKLGNTNGTCTITWVPIV